MNEKIKLFNEQAIKYAQESLNDIAIVNKSGIMYNYNDLYTEKFVQLIVRECAEVVKWTPSVFPNDTIIKNIKEHFGVEE